MTSSTARLKSAGLTLTAVTWLIAALSMLQPLATDLYLPTLPAIARHFDASTATVQWTLSAFVAGFGLWQLAAGPLSDRFGRLPVIVAGVATFCAGSLVCMLAPSVQVLVFGRLLQALGACSCLVGARSVVRDLFAPSEGARLVARAASIMAFAPLLGPLAGAWLGAAFGWRAAFAALALGSAALALLVLTRLRETLQAPDPHALAPGPMLRNYRRIAAAPAFRAYTAAAAISYAGLFAYISGSSFVLMQVHGLTAQQYALAFSAMVAGYLLGTLICRRLTAQLPLQHVVVRGALLQAVAGLVLGGLALGGVHQAWAVAAPMVLYGLSHGIVQPPAQSGAVAQFADNAGTAAALMGFSMMVVAALLGFWIGASYNGTVYPLTLTIGASSLLSAIVAWVWVRRDGDVAHHG